MKSLNKFWNLKPAEKYLLIKAWMLMIIIRLGLSLLTFKRLRQILQRFSRPQASLIQEGISPERIGWLVSVAGRYWYWNKPCLTLALALKLFLDRRRLESEIYLGIRKEQDKLIAHAWIVHDGRIIIGNLPELAEFKEFQPMQ